MKLWVLLPCFAVRLLACLSTAITQAADQERRIPCFSGVFYTEECSDTQQWLEMQGSCPKIVKGSGG